MKQPYKLKDGSIVPGVSTISNLYPDEGKQDLSLIHI